MPTIKEIQPLTDLKIPAEPIVVFKAEKHENGNGKKSLETDEYLDETDTLFPPYCQREIRNHPLLTFKQEIQFAKDLELHKEIMQNAQDLLETTQGEDRVKAEKQYKDAEDFYRAIVAEFTIANLRLVAKEAIKRKSSGLSLYDLVQAGCIGLGKAIEKYDWRRGFRFSTYATRWVVREINITIRNEAKTIRNPSWTYEDKTRQKRIVEQLIKELDRDPTDEEIAEKLGIELTLYKERQRRVFLIPRSLNFLTFEEAEQFSDLVLDPNVNVEEEAINEVFQQQIDDALDDAIKKRKITKRESRVLKLRFGLDEQQPLTLEEVGKIIGREVTKEGKTRKVTKERVRQIEEEALGKLRTFKRFKNLWRKD